MTNVIDDHGHEVTHEGEIKLYDDGHWTLTTCPNFPDDRLHVYVAHNEVEFPKCWPSEAMARFHHAIEAAAIRLQEIAADMRQRDTSDPGCTHETDEELEYELRMAPTGERRTNGASDEGRARAAAMDMSKGFRDGRKS